MKIYDLVQRVIESDGENAVQIQRLYDAVVGAKQRKGGLTELQFLTDGVTCGEIATGDCQRTAFVVWLPTATVSRLIDGWEATRK